MDQSLILRSPDSLQLTYLSSSFLALPLLSRLLRSLILRPFLLFLNHLLLQWYNHFAQFSLQQYISKGPECI
jgi:hypothetical protein